VTQPSLDRVLYHQIHPLKLFTDVFTAFAAAVLLWRHQLGAALALGFLPSIAVSAALIRWADLERYRASAFGRYVGGFMTRRVELARFAGLVPFWFGAWRRSPIAMGAGIIWIIGCWFWGVLRRVIPRSQNS
jgi:hypothetical protein